MTDIDLGWAAGFYEGEGYSRARKGGGGLEVVVGQVSTEPLDKLQRLFGGSIRKDTKRQTYNPHAQPFYFWTIGGVAARKFLEAIYPHVIAPKRRVQIYETMTFPLANRKWARDPERLRAMVEACKELKPGKKNGGLVKRIAEKFCVSPKTIYNIREGYSG
jgi:hypothetical protein